MTLRTATPLRPRKRGAKRTHPAADERHKNHDIYFVPGLRRGLLVLETLATEGRPLSVADIGKRIGLTRSSMFRLAYTLQHMGFIEEIAESKLLRLGPRVLNIGYAYLASQTLIELARPDLEALRDRTGVSSHLAILDRSEILYLSCIQTRSGFLSTMNVGTRLPAYATPMGWLLLSDRSARQLSALYPPASFVPLTDQTPRNLSELAQRIASAVADGHAISRGAVEPGGSSIAAPVRDRERRVVAAIDVSAPDSAFDLALFKTRDVREVMETAARISARLGYAVPRDAQRAVRSGGRGRRNRG
ncbi:MAG TPA: IclR family transcriptional regulator [Casimicrobiaceae bacterium]|nr:IclR family transcriptional regulator [Casimicrobiaceae bacterium]